MGNAAIHDDDIFNAAGECICAALNLRYHASGDDAVRAGDFTAEELETAKAGAISDLRSTPDSQSALESFYLTQAVTGADYSPADLAELVSEVTAERVTAVAKTVECDQIYLLRQESDTDDTDDNPEEEAEDDAEN